MLSFLWTTRRGKFVVWDALLASLALRGDERLLDVGCGRGMVLLLAAQRLQSGRAVGVDLWSTTDQSGNSEQTTLRNAELEGVRDRIELHTADMRRLPFADASFDVITSSLAIHNIRDAQGREQALAEMLRVLKANGTILIADILHTDRYFRYFLHSRTPRRNVAVSAGAFGTADPTPRPQPLRSGTPVRRSKPHGRTGFGRNSS